MNITREPCSPRSLASVEAATVRLMRRQAHAQGVLVPGGLILTAAHCVHWRTDGRMVLGDLRPHRIKAADRDLQVFPLAVEPVADLAVLGAPDDQSYAEEADAFEAFCTTVEPVPLYTGAPYDLPRVLHIFTHTGRWVTGRCRLPDLEGAAHHVAAHVRREWANNPRLFLDVDEPILSGTSGSPVVTEDGQLVGIMSVGSDPRPGQQDHDAEAVRPHLAAPAWLVTRMRGRR